MTEGKSAYLPESVLNHVYSNNRVFHNAFNSPPRSGNRLSVKANAGRGSKMTNASNATARHLFRAVCFAAKAVGIAAKAMPAEAWIKNSRRFVCMTCLTVRFPFSPACFLLPAEPTFDLH